MLQGLTGSICIFCADFYSLETQLEYNKRKRPDRKKCWPFPKWGGFTHAPTEKLLPRCFHTRTHTHTWCRHRPLARWRIVMTFGLTVTPKHWIFIALLKRLPPTRNKPSRAQEHSNHDNNHDESPRWPPGNLASNLHFRRQHHDSIVHNCPRDELWWKHQGHPVLL